MAQVCLLGEEETSLRRELLSRETAREALSTYDLREPYVNTLALETVSIGAAVALLNDLNWYVVRFVRDALVRADSVSEREWLSRDLATAIRDGEVAPDETEEYLRLYGVEENRLVDPVHVRRSEVAGENADEVAGEDDVAVAEETADEAVEETGEAEDDGVLDREGYDELLVVRVTESEFLAA